MKRIKEVGMCILTSAAVFSNCLIVNAESHETVINLTRGIKKYILTDPYNHKYNYSNYDINRNDKVNVLDVCRLKQSIIYNRESEISIDTESTGTTTSQTAPSQQDRKVSFEIADAKVAKDGSTVTLAIKLKNNTIGISALQMDISYRSEYFKLEKVYPGDFNGSWSISNNKKSIQFLEGNGHNIESDGIIAYAKFSISSDVPEGYFDFSLSEITASTLPDGSIQRALTDEECEKSSETYQFKSVISSSTPTATLPEPTTTKITTTSEPTTTKITTTTHETTTTKKTTTQNPQTNAVLFEIGQDIVVSSDNATIKVPIILRNNTKGISACQMDVDYSLTCFNMAKVFAGDFDGSWSKSKSGNTIQFSEANGHNITEDGVIGYIRFEVNPGTPAGIYKFSLSNIQASTLPEGSSQITLTSDECQEESDEVMLSFDGRSITDIFTSMQPVSEVTTTPKQTTTKVTTTPKQTTTKVTTTPKQTTTKVTTTPKQTTTKVTTTPKQTTTKVTTTPKQTTTKDTTTTTAFTMADSPYNEVKSGAADLINQKRAENHLADLVFDTKLSYVADLRAAELAVSYQNLRPDGNTCMSILNENGIGVSYLCQYIMKSHTTPEGIANAITGKTKYLDSVYKKIGIGCYDNGTVYWVVFLTS